VPSRLNDLKAALIFGSRLPVTGPEPFPPLARALRLFPLVGAAPAGIAAGVLALLGAAGLPALPSAVVAVTVQVLLTGALHEDGLADFADGVGGGRTLEAKLAIMKDSRTGVFGVLALVLAVLARVAALSAILDGAGIAAAAAALVAAAAVSRVLPVALLHRLDPARTEGRSAEAGRPSTATLREAAGWGLLVATLTLIPALGTVAMLAVMIGALAVYRGIETFTRRQLGGQTGDAAGAAQQLGEIAVLLILSAAVALTGG
jgi:adenosylcobinamide-GDP ribazoletransferase